MKNIKAFGAVDLAGMLRAGTARALSAAAVRPAHAAIPAHAAASAALRMRRTAAATDASVNGGII
jgi:hypothetical protein